MPIVLCLLFVIVFGVAYSSGMSMYPTVKDDTVLITCRLKEPDYGDIVTIYSDELDKVLLKRVIGKEGDKISIKNGVVYRNNKKLTEEFNKDVTTNLNYTVEANHLFVMGDNRNNSTDSRYLGALPVNNLRGTVIIKTGISKSVFIFSTVLIMGVLICYAYIQDKRDLNRLKNKR